MKITSSSQPYVRPGSLPSSPERNVGHYVPGYTGPKDGLSQQKHQWLTQPLNKALIAGCFRMEVENPENMPPEGAHVYCPTHPSMFDPPLVMALTKRDIRSVANVYVFDGVRGHVMSWGGAFPVNRENATVQSVRHCVDVLKQGKGLCIFPEGRVDEAHAEGKIGQLKRGPAWAALEANAESLIPINVNYEKNTKARPGETAFGVGAALAVAAGGALAAMFGGPAVQVAAGAVTGALAGMYAGGKRAHDRTPNISTSFPSISPLSREAHWAPSPVPWAVARWPTPVRWLAPSPVWPVPWAPTVWCVAGATATSPASPSAFRSRWPTTWKSIRSAIASSAPPP